MKNESSKCLNGSPELRQTNRQEKHSHNICLSRLSGVLMCCDDKRTVRGDVGFRVVLGHTHGILPKLRFSAIFNLADL